MPTRRSGRRRATASGRGSAPGPRGTTRAAARPPARRRRAATRAAAATTPRGSTGRRARPRRRARPGRGAPRRGPVTTTCRASARSAARTARAGSRHGASSSSDPNDRSPRPATAPCARAPPRAASAHGESSPRAPAAPSARRRAGRSPPSPPQYRRDNGPPKRHNRHMTSLVQKAIAEDHHPEDIPRDGYAPATLPIVLGAIMLALTAIVGVALGITLVVYYWTYRSSAG